MASGSVTVSGLAALEAKLLKLPPAILAAAKDANNENALEFMQRIAAIIPRDTGALLDSMKKTEVGPIGVKVEIGDTHPYYLNYVEYGHMDGATHVPARPFWWPTWRLNKKRFKAKTARIVKKALLAAAATNGGS
jgi:hypothetical protein